jgi:hypothetical protein
MENTPNRKISKMEEARAFNAIVNYTTSDPTWPKELVHTKKIDQRRSEDPNVPDEIDFETIYTHGPNKDLKLIYITRIRKNEAGKIEFYIVNKGLGPDREIEMHAIYKYIKENIEPNLNISKEEEGRGLEFIINEILELVMELYNNGEMISVVNYGKPKIRRGPDEEKFRKSLRKVLVDRDRIIYRANWEGQNFLFIIRKIKNEIWTGYINLLREAILFNINYRLSDFRRPAAKIEKATVLLENLEPYNRKISKEEEGRAFQFLRNKSDGCYVGAPKLGTRLKKVGHVVSTDPNKSDVITYGGGENNVFYFVEKDEKGRLCLDVGYAGYKSDNPTPIPLQENIQPNLKISKEEEDYALQSLLRNIDNYSVKKSLRKINHKKYTNPKYPEIIDYMGVSDKGYKIIYSVRKNQFGKIVFYTIDPDSSDYLTSGLVPASSCWHPVELNENYPTGNWQGWGDITQPEKDRLKLILKEIQEHYKKYYHMNISSSYVYLIQKCIDNLDVTDPRDAAKPLSKLSMEHRLFIGDFVDQKDTTGQASKVMDFLMKISRQYIEPPKPPKPDIKLKGITNIVSLSGYSKGDVSISGLEDMNPVINFGYGPYTLDERFINEYSKPGSQLYLDFGQKIKVVNMSEVMAKVKNAIENHKRSLMENLSDDPRYQEATRRMIVRNGFSKQEEDYIRLQLSNMIVDGERLGKTLRKTYHHRTKSPFDYDRIDFSAVVNGKEKIYRVIKSYDKKTAVVRDASMEGDFRNFEVPLLKEEKENPVILTKEDEARAVQFISNLKYDGERAGKILKKIYVKKSDNPMISDTVYYAAIIKEKIYKFQIFRSLRRGLIIFDESNFINHFPEDQIKKS